MKLHGDWKKRKGMWFLVEQQLWNINKERTQKRKKEELKDVSG
jgi:hypothetical protein